MDEAIKIIDNIIVFINMPPHKNYMILRGFLIKKLRAQKALKSIL
jgi:hypothetical protein